MMLTAIHQKVQSIQGRVQNVDEHSNMTWIGSHITKECHDLGNLDRLGTWCNGVPPTSELNIILTDLTIGDLAPKRSLQKFFLGRRHDTRH
jgi:hypothetical protein